MSGNGIPPVVTAAADAPVFTVVITVDAKGTVRVNGPLQNLMLMYGLLETAKDIARNEAAKQANIVQPASAGEIALIKQ